jgi:hypothetical protein
MNEKSFSRTLARANKMAEFLNWAHKIGFISMAAHHLKQTFVPDGSFCQMLIDAGCDVALVENIAQKTVNFVDDGFDWETKLPVVYEKTDDDYNAWILATFTFRRCAYHGMFETLYYIDTLPVDLPYRKHYRIKARKILREAQGAVNADFYECDVGGPESAEGWFKSPNESSEEFQETFASLVQRHEDEVQWFEKMDGLLTELVLLVENEIDALKICRRHWYRKDLTKREKVTSVKAEQLENLQVLETNAPPFFGKESVDWVLAAEISLKYPDEVDMRTLATYRLETEGGIHNATETFGMDRFGRVWRKRTKGSTKVYYWIEYLVSVRNKSRAKA